MFDPFGVCLQTNLTSKLGEKIYTNEYIYNIYIYIYIYNTYVYIIYETMIQNLSVSSVSERSDGASYNIYNVQLFRNSYSLISTGSIISLHLGLESYVI